MANGDKHAVLRALESYINAYPKSTGAWECAVIRQAFLLMNGEATEVDLAEVKRLHTNPLPGQESRVATLLSQYLLDFGRPEDVVGLLTPKLEYEPTLMNHFQLGTALAATGKTAKALDVLRLGKNAGKGDLQDNQAEMLQIKLEALIQELEDAHQ
jgi:hypothetical protein